MRMTLVAGCIIYSTDFLTLKSSLTISSIAFAATSFGNSSLQHLPPLLKLLPHQLDLAFPSVLSLIPGFLKFIPSHILETNEPFPSKFGSSVYFDSC